MSYHDELCQPCGDCGWCLQRWKWKRDALRLRRRDRRWSRIAGDMLELLYLVDPEVEHPTAQSMVRRIRMMLGGSS